MLQKLRDKLQSQAEEAKPWLDHCTNIAEVYRTCVRRELREDWEQVLNKYKETFKVLEVKFGKHASLKSHVIQDHLGDFFREAKATFHDCNDQHVEANNQRVNRELRNTNGNIKRPGERKDTAQVKTVSRLNRKAAKKLKTS